MEKFRRERIRVDNAVFVKRKSDKIQNLHLVEDYWWPALHFVRQWQSQQSLVAVDPWPLHQYRVLGRQPDGAKDKMLKIHSDQFDIPE